MAAEASDRCCAARSACLDPWGGTFAPAWLGIMRFLHGTCAIAKILDFSKLYASRRTVIQHFLALPSRKITPMALLFSRRNIIFAIAK